MKNASARTLLLALIFASYVPYSVAAKPIVASGSQLEIGALSSENRFDVATLTVTGPDGFEKQITVSSNNTEIDLEQLGIEKDGNYSYQIEYAEQGKVEIVNDAKNGRSGTKRNLGKVETKSGFFNIKDSEFVQEEANGEGVEKIEKQIDISNFEIVDENFTR